MPVPDFSPGEVLTAAAMDSIGLWKVAEGTFSGITTGAPLDVNNVFSSNYTNYRLLLRCSQTVANGSTAIRMRTVAAQENGAVYNYGWGGAWVNATPTYFFAGFAQTNPFAPDTAFFAGTSIGTGYSGTSRIDIFSPQKARVTRLHGQAYTDYTGTVYNTALTGSGEVSTNSQYTGFRLFPLSGTMSGEYVLYGYRD